ncbi:hypothetical protein FCH28_34980 [Streptomyces piniterrae]|uniref:LTXXQ motif family protein n=1 Tax=Streptomyces piniterrae TaxID=2571125 RepID=A0A4U0MYD2_9ACTN|nr:hypothetical protein [Streptomyces piniterrae]TJZ42224.1 hypothetical protein FCH28_34980 [Streptomyces piniterrae]
MQRPKTAVATALAGLALAGSLLSAAAPANAAESGGGPAASPSKQTSDHQRHAQGKGEGKGKGKGKGICARVPRLEKRIDRALARLNGGVHTRGSIARMEQRVKNARAKDHDEVATFLQDRLTRRKQLKPGLTRQRGDLKAVAEWCSTRDNSKAGDGS